MDPLRYARSVAREHGVERRPIDWVGAWLIFACVALSIALVVLGAILIGRGV